MPINSTRGAGSAKGFGFTAGAKLVEIDYLVVAGGGAGGAGYGGGGGGGAGGYVEFYVNTPIATSTIIGAGGNGGNSGTNTIGGNGGSGIIIVEEMYI